MPKRNGVADETVECFCNRRFSRLFDEQLRELVGEIVAGRSMHRPFFAQCFRAGENFFRYHVDRPAVARPSDPERFRGTLLKFDEIFAR